MNKKSRKNFLSLLNLNISELSENELSLAIEDFDILLDEIPLSLLANKKLAFAFSMQDPSNFERLNNFHDDEDFVCDLIKYQPSSYKYATKRVKDLQYIIEDLCVNSPKYFILLPEKFRANKELVFLTFESDASDEVNSSWLSVLEPVCNDKKFVKNILATNKGIYKYLNDELKNNDELIKLVINDFYKFKYLPEDKKENIEYMNLACKKSGMPIKDFSLKALNNPEVMIDFLKRFPGAICWCGNAVKNNEKIAMEICNENLSPHPYSFFSEKIRNNEIIAEKSILAHVSSTEYIPYALTTSKKLLQRLIDSPKFNFECIQWFDESVKDSVDIMQLAVKKDNRSLQYLGSNLKKDKDFIGGLLTATESNMFSQISKWKEIFSLLSYKDADINFFSFFLEKIQETLHDKTYLEQSAAFKSLIKELKDSSFRELLIDGDCIANYQTIILKANLDSTLSSKTDRVKIKI